ncbi:MAG: pyridoxal-phosphate dependent enzyme, partial [Sulfitobacter sp.]
MSGIKNSILDTVGDTPIVRINKLAPDGVEIFVKLEAFNPMGSVKDRLALGVIEAAEKDGTIAPGQTVVEATSGNTGIGLAMVCAQKGYPLVVTMAESFSVERRQLMRFLGAKVVLTPAAEKGTGMVAKAKELAKAHGWFQSRQFENPANADIHTRTTAVEIARDFEGIGLDYWVSGFGTGGTLNGVARGLGVLSPKTKIIVAEPDNAAILASGDLNPVNADGTPVTSHPGFRPHLMQGWSPDFISSLTQEAVENGYVDAFQPVSGVDATAMAKALAQQEGIFCGTSGGATFAAALAVAKTAPKGSKILAMLPDTGERYLSTPLFADVSIEMTAAEMELSMSTPNIRFDVASTPAAAPVASAKPDAIAQVERIVADKPVVMFALEWCEFCWSVRKMFAEAGIAYETVDLDSVAYQKNGIGADIRAALRDMTGAATIPRVFVGGQH